MNPRSAAADYVFEPSHREHDRLVAMARFYADEVRDACRRAGLGAGARVIDVGCGPLGALPVLAEVVGPGGLVVGLDRSPDALATARQLLDEQGLGRVDLVRADIATADPAAIAPAGLFDAAHCRYVLMHHPDPAATLRRIAALVRPGGTILVRDLVDDPTCCRCEPPLPALERGYALMFAAIGHLGGAHGVARRYRRVCQSAGVEVVEQRGLVSHFDAPTLLFTVIQSALLAMRGTLEEGRLSTDGEVASLVEELEAAKTAAFDYVQGPLMVDLLARVPAQAGDGLPTAAE